MATEQGPASAASAHPAQEPSQDLHPCEQPINSRSSHNDHHLHTSSSMDGYGDYHHHQHHHHHPQPAQQPHQPPQHPAAYHEYGVDLLQDLGASDPSYDLFYGGYGGSDVTAVSQRPFSAGSSSCSSAESADTSRQYVPSSQVYCHEEGGHFAPLQCYAQQPQPQPGSAAAAPAVQPPAYTSVIVAAAQQYPHPINDEFVH